MANIAIIPVWSKHKIWCKRKKGPFQNVVQWSQVWNVNFGESRGRDARFFFLPLSHSPSRPGNVFVPARFLLSVSSIVLVCTRDKKHVLVQTWHVWPPTIWSLIKLYRQVFMCKVGHCLVAWSIWPDLCPLNKILIARIFNRMLRRRYTVQECCLWMRNESHSQIMSRMCWSKS